jgi:CelD/BcsL family acetyltransferase involved in cellulose biosynthesis
MSTEKYALEIWGESEFVSSEQEWNGLLAGSNADSLFSSWSWLSSWWFQWQPSASMLQILVVRNELGDLVGAAPFYRQRVKLLGGLFRVIRLSSLGSTHKGGGFRTEYQQFISQADQEQEITSHLWGGVFDLLDWDELMIADLVSGSATEKCLQKRDAHKAYCRIEKEEPIYQIEALGEFSDYVSALGKNTRLKFFNRRTLLKKHGAVELERWPSARFGEFVERLNCWHLARWDKLCFDKPAEQFLNKITAWLESNEGLVCHVLTIDKQPVAVSLDLMCGHRLYNIQHGYMLDFDKKISLGLLMLGYVAEWGFQKEEVHYCDLLAGTGKNINYKARIAEPGSVLCSFRLIRGPIQYVYRIYDGVKNIGNG